MECGKMCSKRNCLLIFGLILGFLHTSQVDGQIATYAVHLKDLLKLQNGLGWPKEMLVAEGQEALMKLTSTLPNQQSCTVTTPTGAMFDVSTPPSARYQQWTDGCGLRVRQVAASDEGRWRLTATQDDASITGWIEVTVNQDTTNYTAPPISLQDGETETDVELTSLDNSYCLVSQPFSESVLVAGHCRMTLDRTTRAVQGNWNILIGLPGQISELRVQRQVAVEAERLDVGYTHDTNKNKLHLYCNILHSTKNVTFCRFQKTTSSSGFNVMEGLSDGAHSYYGSGFVEKQCGMTIEHPTGQDYGTWRCSVGSQQWVGNTIVQQQPMQALVNVMAPRSQRVQRDVQLTQETQTVFVQEDLSFTLTCQAGASLSYCWFLHPNGSQFSPVPKVSEDQLFWYTGQSLQTGECGITFSEAHERDAGDWVCHMGLTNQLGVEHSELISVRVTGPLAAHDKELEVALGQKATLLCHTANGNRPLEYCRFLTPKFVGIRIDSSVTETSTIMDRFYFMPDRSLNYGDCSLVISSVQPEDLGQWSCAARINGDAMESVDTIELFISHPSDERAPLSRAGIVGMSIGALALIVLLAGVAWYKIGRPVLWRSNRSEPDSLRDVPFDLMSMNTATARGSARCSSNNSVGNRSTSSGEEITMGVLELSSIRERPMMQGDPLGVSAAVFN